MRRAGYTDIAISLSLESLKQKELILFDEEPGDFGRDYTVCRITPKGIGWLLENQDRFQFTVRKASRAPTGAELTRRRYTLLAGFPDVAFYEIWVGTT